MKALAHFGPELRASRILQQTKALLRFVSTFDQEYPNLKKIRDAYAEEFTEMKLLS